MAEWTEIPYPNVSPSRGADRTGAIGSSPDGTVWLASTDYDGFSDITIFYSKDKGVTWFQAADQPSGMGSLNDDSVALNLWAYDGVFYIATGGSIFSSGDDGSTWTEDVTMGFQHEGVEITKPTFLGETAWLHVTKTNGVWRTTDTTSWVDTGQVLDTNTSIVNHSGTLYIFGTNADGFSAFITSSDEGATWSSPTLIDNDPDIQAVVSTGERFVALVQATFEDDSGFTRTKDRIVGSSDGVSWSTLFIDWSTATDTITEESTKALHLVADKNVIMAITQGDYLVVSTDGGNSWTVQENITAEKDGKNLIHTANNIWMTALDNFTDGELSPLLRTTIDLNSLPPKFWTLHEQTREVRRA